VHGSNVMLGYYWAPALTAQAIYADGSFNTGDPPVSMEPLPVAAGKFLKHKLWEAAPAVPAGATTGPETRRAVARVAFG